MIGCWTCRIRKKKCNKQAPSCAECARLSITCGGYGARPPWIDGGTQESRYRTQLKAHIRQRGREKRLNGLSQSYTPTSASVDFNDDVDFTTLPDDFDSFLTSSTTLIKEVGVAIGDLIPSPNSMSDRSLSLDSGYNSSSGIVANQDTSLKTQSYEEVQESSLSTNVFSTAELHQNPCLSLSDCKALTHYLDHTFWEQFPNCRSTSTALDRTWISACFSTSRNFRDALRSIAHIPATKSVSNPVGYFSGKDIAGHSCQILRDTWEKIALESFLVKEKVNVELMIVSSAPILYCASKAGDERLLIAVLRDIKKALSILFTRDNMRQVGCQHDVDQCRTATVLNPALACCLAQAYWIDTFRAAFLRTDCILQTPDVLTNTALKKDIDNQISALYGCESWPLWILRDAVQLDSWKQQSSRCGRLSAPELVSKGMQILSSIERRTAMERFTDLDHDPANSTGLPSFTPNSEHTGSSNVTVDTSAIITQVHTCAVMVYVHVIMSGASPYLPEIQTSVDKAIKLLQRIQNLDILNSMAWPLTVIACLSSCINREICRCFLLKASAIPTLQQVCTRVLNLAQECWRLEMETPLLLWDWNVALESLETLDRDCLAPR